jgi:hypothetical protein
MPCQGAEFPQVSERLPDTQCGKSGACRRRKPFRRPPALRYLLRSGFLVPLDLRRSEMGLGQPVGTVGSHLRSGALRVTAD